MVCLVVNKNQQCDIIEIIYGIYWAPRTLVGSRNDCEEESTDDLQSLVSCRRNRCHFGRSRNQEALDTCHSSFQPNHFSLIILPELSFHCSYLSMRKLQIMIYRKIIKIKIYFLRNYCLYSTMPSTMIVLCTMYQNYFYLICTI